MEWTIVFQTRPIVSRSEIDNVVTTPSNHSNTRKVFRAENVMSAGQLLLYPVGVEKLDSKAAFSLRGVVQVSIFFSEFVATRWPWLVAESY